MSHKHRSAGFSLLEVLIVLVIASGVTVLLTTNFLNNLEKRSFSSASDEIAQSLTKARLLARRTREAVLWEYDRDTHSISYGKTYEFSLPQGVSLTLSYADSVPRPGILFYGDGASSGGMVTVEHQYDEIEIEVDWLLGVIRRDVEISEK